MKMMKKQIMKILEHLTPSCDVITEKISQSLDRKLSIKERIQIKIHLLYCKYCLRYRDQILFLRRIMEEDRSSILKEVKLNPEQKTRIKKHLKDSC